MKLVFCPVLCSTQTAFWICSLGRSLSISHQFTLDRDKTINRCSVYNIFFLIQQWIFNLLAKVAEFANWHLINAMSASLGHLPVNSVQAIETLLDGEEMSCRAGWLDQRSHRVSDTVPHYTPLSAPLGPVVFFSHVYLPQAMKSVADQLEKSQSLWNW